MMKLFDYYKNMLNVLLEPKKTMRKNKKINLKEGSTYVLLALLVSTALSVAIGIPIMLITTLLNWGTISSGLLSLLTTIFVTPIITFASVLLGGFIMWVIARFFGCKKETGNFIGAYGLANSPAILLGWIPLLNILLWLYTIYLEYVMLVEAMEMKKGKAIMTILVPLAILFALLMIVAVIAIAFLAMGGTITRA